MTHRMKITAQSCLAWLLNFAHVQIFLTLISLPFLVAWGLPLSFMAPIGNIIFLPFLTIFLFIATLIFFFELCAIPNIFLIYMLEKIISIWLYLMSFSSKTWLISFAKPSLLFLVCIPICALAILFKKKRASSYCTTLALLGTLLFFCACLKYPFFSSEESIVSVPCNKGEIIIVRKDAQISIIDPGYLGQTISSPTWIEFTLVPLLNQHFGSQTIHHLILLQPSIMTFACVEKLCQLCTVRHCYIPLWQGTADRSLLRSYGCMRHALENNTTHLVRIKNAPLPLDALTIYPLESMLSYKDITFKTMRVNISLKEKKLEIYSAKKQK